MTMHDTLACNDTPDRPATLEDMIRAIVREEVMRTQKAASQATIDTVRKNLAFWQHQTERDGSCC